jgi:hypothetical protein
MQFEGIQSRSQRTITYGSLALVGPAPACRERPADGYRCRPAPDVAPVSLAPASPAPVFPAAAVSPALVPPEPISPASIPPEPISSASISAEPVSPASRPGADVVLSRRELAVRRADAVALSLCAARLTLGVPLTRVAAAIVASSAWSAFGFARARDFARERLCRSGRWLSDLAALHERVEALPGLEAALTGAGGRSAGWPRL